VAQPQEGLFVVGGDIGDGESHDAACGLGIQHHQQASDAVGDLELVVVQQPPGQRPALLGVGGLGRCLLLAGRQAHPCRARCLFAQARKLRAWRRVASASVNPGVSANQRSMWDCWQVARQACWSRSQARKRAAWLMRPRAL
jgi:hypothetical protein